MLQNLNGIRVENRALDVFRRERTARQPVGDLSP